MNCKTRKEKVMEAMENVKRFFLITVITVLGTTVAAFILVFMMTVSENKELKEQNAALKKTVESYSEKEEKSTTSYTVVIDDKTGKILYTDF